jgi:hypothetical protein
VELVAKENTSVFVEAIDSYYVIMPGVIYEFFYTGGYWRFTKYGIRRIVTIMSDLEFHEIY